MFHRNLLVGLLLLSIFICAQCASVQSADEQASNSNALARQRRQISPITVLTNALNALLSGVLLFVQQLLIGLTLALASILNGLGLPGLTLVVATLLTGLALLVNYLRTPQRRDASSVSSSQATAALQAALDAVENAKALQAVAQGLQVTAPLQGIVTTLEGSQTQLKGASPPLLTIVTSVNSALTSLTGIVTGVEATVVQLATQFTSNTTVIFSGLGQLLTYVSGQVPNFPKVTKKSPTLLPSLFQNISIAQNITAVSLNNFNVGTGILQNATIALLAFNTVGLSGLVVDALGICPPTL